MENSPLEGLSTEEQRALVEIARKRVDGSMTRRDMTKLASLGAVGALFGGGGVAATGIASAGASTSDSDGDLGAPDDRWDVFAQAIDAEQVSSTDFFVDPSGGLQAAVDDVVANGGVVRLKPGVHNGHNYPVTVPSGVTIEGPNMGSMSPNGDVTPALLDAGGGVALKVHDGETTGKATTLRDFAVLGTIQYTAGTNRDFLLENVYVEGATTTAGTGRGIEITGSAFLYTVRNIHVEQCDGYGYYSEHGGQATVDTVRVFDCGTAVDGGQIYISDAGGGGGEGDYRRLVAGIGDATNQNVQDGIVADRLFSANITAPQIEQCDRGLFFDEESGDSKANRISGGRILSNNIGIRAGDGTTTGNTYRTYGNIVDGVNFDANATDDIHLASEAWRWFIGPCTEANASQQIGAFSVTNNGWENMIDPVNNLMPNSGSEDLTTRSGSFMSEWSIHDGTDGANVNAAGPAWWDGSNWISVVDGGTIA